MTLYKPSNIFSFLAPTGGATKIANFGTQKTIASTASIASAEATSIASNISNATNLEAPGKNNTWLYVLGGAALLGIGYWIYSDYQKRQVQNNRLNIILPKDDTV